MAIKDILTKKKANYPQYLKKFPRLTIEKLRKIQKIQNLSQITIFLTQITIFNQEYPKIGRKHNNQRYNRTGK